MKLTQKLAKLGASVGAAVSGAIIMATNTVMAMADVDVDSTVNTLRNGSSDGGSFKNFLTKLTTVGSDIYTVAVTLGIIVTLLCVAYVGITFISTKNANKREESKGWLFSMCVGGIFLFGAPTLTVIIAGIVNQF